MEIRVIEVLLYIATHIYICWGWVILIFLYMITVYVKTVEGENFRGFCSIAKVFPSKTSLD